MVFAMAFVLMGGLALAADTPHGPFADNTELCAACHRAHTAQAEYLIADNNTIGICTACHDGSGADTNVVTGTYVVNGSWTSSALGTRGAALTVTAYNAVSFTITTSANPITAGYIAGEIVAVAAPGANAATFNGNTQTIASVTATTIVLTAALPVAAVNGDMVGNVDASANDHDSWGTATSPLLGGGFQNVRVPGGMTSAPSTSNHIANVVNGATKWGIQFGEGSTKPGANSATLALTCVSCHIPHRSANYRMLRGAPQGLNSDDTNILIVGDNFTRNAQGGIIAGTLFNGSHQYTEDTGRFNLKTTDVQVTRGAGNVANDGISAWCGACHDYYYDNAGKASARGTSPSAPTVTALTANTAIAGTTLVVASNTGAIVNGTVVLTEHFLNPVKDVKVSKVITAVAGTTITVKGTIGKVFDFAAVATVSDPTVVTFTGQGQATYYDVDGQAAPAAFMHSVDVTMNYLPRNGSTGTQTLALYSNLGGGTFLNRLPVAAPAEANAYAAADQMNCLTCHRAHGTEATMAGQAAIGVKTRLGIGAQGRNAAEAMTDSVLLRLPNRAVCETCHQMPTGY